MHKQNTRRLYIRSSSRPYSGNRFGCLAESLCFIRPFAFVHFEMSYNFPAFNVPTFAVPEMPFSIPTFAMPEMPFSIPTIAGMRAALPSVPLPSLERLKQTGESVKEKALAVKKFIQKKPAVKVTKPRTLIAFDVDTARLFSERTTVALTIEGDAQQQVEAYEAESIELRANAMKAVDATIADMRQEKVRYKKKMHSLRLQKKENDEKYAKTDEERKKGLQQVLEYKLNATNQQKLAMIQHLALTQAMQGGINQLQLQDMTDGGAATGVAATGNNANGARATSANANGAAADDLAENAMPACDGDGVATTRGNGRAAGRSVHFEI